MSVSPPLCGDCRRETVYDGVGPFPAGEEANYAVAWRCPGCGKRSLDVCPLGPLVPDPDCCLNCGGSFGGGRFCPDCGMTPGQVETFFGQPADDAELIPAARDAFQARLFRRGLALANRALQRDFGTLMAWQLKLSFLGALRFTRTKRLLLEQALAKGAPSALRLWYGMFLADEGAHTEAAAVFRAFLDGSPAPAHAGVARAAMARSLAALKGT